MNSGFSLHSPLPPQPGQSAFVSLHSGSIPVHSPQLVGQMRSIDSGLASHSPAVAHAPHDVSVSLHRRGCTRRTRAGRSPSCTASCRRCTRRRAPSSSSRRACRCRSEKTTGDGEEEAAHQLLRFVCAPRRARLRSVNVRSRRRARYVKSSRVSTPRTNFLSRQNGAIVQRCPRAASAVLAQRKTEVRRSRQSSSSSSSSEGVLSWGYEGVLIRGSGDAQRARRRTSPRSRHGAVSIAIDVVGHRARLGLRRGLLRLAAFRRRRRAPPTAAYARQWLYAPRSRRSCRGAGGAGPPPSRDGAAHGRSASSRARRRCGSG